MNPNQQIDGRSLLSLAVEKNDYREIEEVLNLGASVNEVDASGLAPIHLAVMRGNPLTLRLLLGRGADTELRAPDGATPLMMAARNGDERQEELLLDYGARVDAVNDGRTALHYAVLSRSVPAAELLLRWRAAVNAKGPPKSDTPLEMAVFFGDLAMAAELIRWGADVNAAGIGIGKMPILSWTIVNNDVEMARLLLEHGADPSIAKRSHLYSFRGSAAFIAVEEELAMQARRRSRGKFLQFPLTDAQYRPGSAAFLAAKGRFEAMQALRASQRP